MVFKRRRSLRRRFARRVRSRGIARSFAAWRRVRVMRSAVSPTAIVHKHHRWANSINMNNTDYCTFLGGTTTLQVSQNITSARIGMAFNLQDVPDYSEFTNLYDQYKIKMVKVTIKMINDPSATNIPTGTTSNNTNTYPTIWMSPDHDDNTTITLDGIKAFSRVKHKVLRPNSEVTFLVRPTTLQQLYLSSTQAAYAVNYKQPWLDMANSNIPHYGAKFVIDFEGLQTPTTNYYLFKFNIKYYFMCKNAR